MTFEEYKEQVKQYLITCSYKYSEQGAQERVESCLKQIKESFENGDPVDDCAIDIGYCCG